MGTIAVHEFITLDGVVENPAWTSGYSFDPRMGDAIAGIMGGSKAILLGRRTYDIWAAYWPAVTGESDQIAAALNTRPKYVASATLKEPAWKGTRVLRDVPGEVPGLREQPGPPILLMGSSTLAQSLMAYALVDEYQLWLHPVVLGGGKKLFRDGGPAISLRLARSTPTAGGLVILSYEPS